MICGDRPVATAGAGTTCCPSSKSRKTILKAQVSCMERAANGVSKAPACTGIFWMRSVMQPLQPEYQQPTISIAVTMKACPISRSTRSAAFAGIRPKPFCVLPLIAPTCVLKPAPMFAASKSKRCAQPASLSIRMGQPEPYKQNARLFWQQVPSARRRYWSCQGLGAVMCCNRQAFR